MYSIINSSQTVTDTMPLTFPTFIKFRRVALAEQVCEQ